MGVQGSSEELRVGKKLVSRRAVNIGAAWSVPVILTAVAAPTASASPNPVDPGTPQATLGTATAHKGQAVSGNRQVSFALAFVNISGTNTVQITNVTGYTWTPLPTSEVTVDAAHPTASFLLTRPGTDNSNLTVTVSYTVNGGTPKTVPVYVVQ